MTIGIVNRLVSRRVQSLKKKIEREEMKILEERAKTAGIKAEREFWSNLGND